MRKVQTKFLSPGMKLALAVFNSEGIILLQEGQVLTEKYIDRLKKSHIPFIYTEDEDIPANVIMDIISTQSRAEAVRSLREWIFNPEENKLIKAGGSAKLLDLINNLLGELKDNPERCVKFLDVRALDDYTYGHSVNVCLLSLITGLSMNMTDEELLVLGLAALLHDIGKVKLPAQLVNKAGAFTPVEHTLMEQHPIYGFELIMADPLLNPIIAEIIYQHHERFNGSGYPRGLTEVEIHPCAYIIGIADVYDALTHDRAYRGRFLPHEAIEYLYGSGNHLFDYNVVKNFVQHLALYPIGTLVELNNGEQGTVIDVQTKLPARPILRIHRDGEGNLLPYPYVRDLTTETTLVITDVLE